MPGEVRAGGPVGLGRRRPKRVQSSEFIRARVQANKRHMHGQAPTKGLGAVRARLRGAHPKHPVHGRDLGRVEAQRLIERLRALSSHREGTMPGEVRVGGQVGLGRRRPKRCMRVGRVPD